MAEAFNFQLRISGPDLTQVFVIPLGVTAIGRDASKDLVLPSSQVSRQHAQLIRTETECQIVDTNSANGTLVNGEKLVPKIPLTLSDQALIKIGPFEIVFEQVPIEAPTISQEGFVRLSELLSAPAEPAEEQAEPSDQPQEEAAEPPAEKMEIGGQEPPPPPPPPEEPTPVPESPVPPGLTIHSQRLLQYLPGIYETDFMDRFLALFESILLPIEWNVDNFDLFLDPGTSPYYFLPWLANWYDIAFDTSWNEAQRRTFLKEAYRLYARRGTPWALRRLLEIYTGCEPEIIEFSNPQEPFTFTVRFPKDNAQGKRELIERLIDANKPTHTVYTLEFSG